MQFCPDKDAKCTKNGQLLAVILSTAVCKKEGEGMHVQLLNYNKFTLRADTTGHQYVIYPLIP